MPRLQQAHVDSYMAKMSELWRYTKKKTKPCTLPQEERFTSKKTQGMGEKKQGQGSFNKERE